MTSPSLPSVPSLSRAARGSVIACALSLLLGLTLLAPFAEPAVAGGRPDLRVTKLAVTPDAVAVGGVLTLKDTVSNAGKSRAGKSKVRYYLSRDPRQSGRDVVIGGHHVPQLRPGAKTQTSTTVSVPDSVKAGAWYVVACADAARRVAESKERNNCRASADPVRVEVTTDGPTFPMESDPLTVESTIQADRAVTAKAYSHQDTTIEATAVDGTTYTLLVPAEALLSPEDITLTPVSSVDGLPLSGGMVAAVQIEPHGLMLLKPASLTIESPDAGPVRQQTGFLFHEDGEDAHTYPMDAPEPGDDKDVVRMTLTHFSTPGVGAGTAAEQGELAGRIPDRAQSQVAAAIAGLLSSERAHQLQGADPDPAVAAQIVAILNQFHDDVVRPRMKAAETNKDLATEAIALGLGWSRQLLLLGDEDNPRHEEIKTRVETILRNVLDESWQECLDHDLRAILALFRVARVAALMGYAWQQEAFDKAVGCGRFEIRFDSVIDSSHSWSGNLQNGSSEGHWHTEGTVETHLLDPNAATGPLTWRAFSYSSRNTITDPGHTCHTSTTGTSTAPGRLRATASPLLGTLNAYEGGGTPPPVPVSSYVGVVSDAKPTETYLHTSCDGSTSTTTDSRWFWHYETTGKFWTTDPAQQVGDFIDSKTFTVSDVRPPSSVVEETTVEVWHKPTV